jgi:coenzyme F420 hydrogenase subunit beta
MLKKIETRLWNKDFSQDEIDRYLGDYKACYFTYASDNQIREKASSGGSVTGLLLHLLASGEIDGAVVCRSYVQDDAVHVGFTIAQSREDLIAAQGSKYAAVYFAAQALPMIRAFEGKLAVVALPCDAMILHRYRAKHPAVDAKIKCVIALFCGHNSEPELTAHVVDKLRPELRPAPNVELVDYVYRRGHWRGELAASYADGTTITKPFAYFSDYRNGYFYAQSKCHHCYDHFGYYCDISAGDIWSPHMRHEPIKHTALVTRSEAGQQLVTAALEAGDLTGELHDVKEVVNGQSRTAPFHYNITARARVARLFGVKIKDRTETKVRWNDYIVALMALANERVSKTRLGRHILRIIPRPVIKAYLYVLKGLESF